jgi:hypothetical protein
MAHSNPAARAVMLLAAAALVLIALPGLAGQTAKNAPAKVVIAGKEVGAITIEVGDKKSRFVMIELDKGTTVKVPSNEDVTKYNEKLMAKHAKLTEEFTALVKKLIETNQLDDLKKAEAEFKANSDEMLKYLSYLAAEGSLSLVDGEPQLTGKVRTYDYKGTDKVLGKGKALVEGEAIRVPHDAGKGKKDTLAIQNGDYPIIVTGKAGEDNLSAKGTLRVIGTLRAAKGGPIVLEADTVEVLKK